MLQQLLMCIRMVVKNDRGAAAIEYGLLAALVGVALFAGAKLLGESLDGLFNTVGTFLGQQVPLGGGGTP